jgi:hypothetical protein
MMNNFLTKCTSLHAARNLTKCILRLSDKAAHVILKTLRMESINYDCFARSLKRGNTRACLLATTIAST